MSRGAWGLLHCSRLRTEARHGELRPLVRANDPAITGRRSEDVCQRGSEHSRVGHRSASRSYHFTLRTAPCGLDLRALYKARLEEGAAPASRIAAPCVTRSENGCYCWRGDRFGLLRLDFEAQHITPQGNKRSSMRWTSPGVKVQVYVRGSSSSDCDWYVPHGAKTRAAECRRPAGRRLRCHDNGRSYGPAHCHPIGERSLHRRQRGCESERDHRSATKAATVEVTSASWPSPVTVFRRRP